MTTLTGGLNSSSPLVVGPTHHGVAGGTGTPDNPIIPAVGMQLGTGAISSANPVHVTAVVQDPDTGAYVAALPYGIYPCAVEITPSDSADLSFKPLSIWVGTAGDIRFTPVGGGSPVVQKNLWVGYHNIYASKIWASGTTATDLIGYHY